ncbi:MAG: cbb3-type cytochrome oxidase assembly protein CcoS [Campylobacter sp.]
MSDFVLAAVIGASVFLGALGLLGARWGVKSGQFDDERKFFDGALYDDEDALNDAYELELRRKEKGYKPPE